MSREIKLRAWDTVLNEWNNATYTQQCIQDENENNFGAILFCPQKRMIIEQYTGLKDKNGKEIYEGDIVSCYSLSGEYGALFVVKYDELPDICGHEYCPCLQGFYLDEIDEYEEVDEDGYMEVIGNIHENPELLGGE